MDSTLLHRVDDLLRAKNDKELRQALNPLDALTIADIIDNLEHGKRKTFTLIPPEKQAAVVKIISENSRDIILPRLPSDMISRFLHFLYEDDATDIIQHLPRRLRGQVLHGLQEDRRKRIEKLLTFGPETAGGIMDLNFLEVEPNVTVQSTIESLQKYTKIHKQVPTVLVQTPKGIRWLQSRILLTASKQASVLDLSQSVSTVLHSADREKVLDVMERESSDILCVIDEEKKMLGIIHLNDLLRVAEAETSEDVYRMGAVGAMNASYLESKFSTIWKKRVGWLSVLFVAELFTFTALTKYESSIASVTALALFLPLCISTGGNSGSQAATLITRAMALGHVTTKDWWRVLRRELLMGLALGIALGVVGFVRGALTPQSALGSVDRFMIGIVIAGSVAAICLWGTLVGSMLPMIFRKMGFDPAYASSPFVATFVDVTGIVIYFTIANIFIV